MLGALACVQVRNLALGVAARGVNWDAQGMRGSIFMLGSLCVRIFGNLFHRSENIAQAMVVRGFQGPANHNMYLMRVNKTSWLANLGAVFLLALYCYLIYAYK